MKYNNETFKQYCEDNHLFVIGDYTNIKQDSPVEGHCPTEGCSIIFNKSFRSIIRNGAYCTECAKKRGAEKSKDTFLKKYNGNPSKCKEVIEKIKKTNLERYGVENPFQSKQIQEKIKKTNVERYGVETVTQNKEVIQKMKKTNLERYGAENPSQSKQIKEKIKQTNLSKYGVEHPLQNKEVIEKVKKTNMARYGSENTFQVEEFKEKSKITNMEKYGVEYAIQNKDIQENANEINLKKYGSINPLENPEVMAKMKKKNVEKYGCEYTLQVKEFRDKGIQTNLERYGVEYATQSQEFKDKCIATSLLRYGTRHPMQNKEIMSKNTASQYKKKKYTLPSKKVIDIQGYEHFALDDLLKTYREEEIVSGNDNVPEIWYETDKTHRHYVDFYIPKENLCIEIKSEWTLKTKKDNIFIKQAAAKESGYKYEIWVYNAEGKKIKTI